MATYTTVPYERLFKVEYVDPAGSFGGWFVRVFSVQDTDHSTQIPNYLATNDNPTRIAVQAQIEDHLRSLGIFGQVTWVATLLNSVTPAVLDSNV